MVKQTRHFVGMMLKGLIGSFYIWVGLNQFSCIFSFLKPNEKKKMPILYKPRIRIVGIFLVRVASFVILVQKMLHKETFMNSKYFRLISILSYMMLKKCWLNIL